MEKLVFNQKLSTMIKNTNKVENILVLNTFDIKHLNLPVFFLIRQVKPWKNSSLLHIVKCFKDIFVRIFRIFFTKKNQDFKLTLNAFSLSGSPLLSNLSSEPSSSSSSSSSSLFPTDELSSPIIDSSLVISDLLGL